MRPQKSALIVLILTGSVLAQARAEPLSTAPVRPRFATDPASIPDPMAERIAQADRWLDARDPAHVSVFHRRGGRVLHPDTMGTSPDTAAAVAVHADSSLLLWVERLPDQAGVPVRMLTYFGPDGQGRRVQATATFRRTACGEDLALHLKAVLRDRGDGTLLPEPMRLVDDAGTAYNLGDCGVQFDFKIPSRRSLRDLPPVQGLPVRR